MSESARIKASARALRENTWDFLRHVGRWRIEQVSSELAFPTSAAASAAERWLLMVTPLKVGGISRVLTPTSLSPTVAAAPPVYPRLSACLCFSRGNIARTPEGEGKANPRRFNRVPVNPYPGSLHFSRTTRTVTMQIHRASPINRNPFSRRASGNVCDISPFARRAVKVNSRSQPST